MKAAVAQAMEEGALGLSSALIYVPGLFASTDELVALARVAARYGGSYITHQRDEGDDGAVGLDASMDEVFRVAREAQIPAEIYHLKASGKRAWGRMPGLLRRIEEARAEGLDVSADQYPWAASSNNLDASLPVWVREGGAERMVARLTDPATRARARADFLALPENADWPAGATRILVTSVLNPELKKYEGLTLDEIAKERGAYPADALMDVVVADRGNTARVTFGMSEDDVRAALRHPLVSFCTDSEARAEDGVLSKQKSHPRAFGSAARILGHYVRDERVLGLEEAVRKMTSLPASRMRLRDRGVLRAGMAADIVAFDPLTVRERATYADPLHYSEGIPYVAVNGRLVVDEGRITEARPGRVLRGPGTRARRPAERSGRPCCRPASAPPAVLGERLERGVAVHVGEGRVVVERLGDVVGGGGGAQERLPHVDDLARGAAHHVRADEPERRALEDELQHPSRLAEDLAARVLVVVAPAGHVVGPLRDERLLGLADVGHLGDRVDGEGQRPRCGPWAPGCRGRGAWRPGPAPSTCWRAPGSR